MDKLHMTFGGMVGGEGEGGEAGAGAAASGGSENMGGIIVGGLASMGGLNEYSQIQGVVGGVGSDSDDSRSSISRSDDNEGLPSIIYTSDDSADVGRSDSTCVDSDGLGYIAQHVQLQDDETSRRLLLDSECPSPQPSPQPEPCFTMSHPLAAATFTTEDCKFDRSTSVSSSSSGSSPEAQQPLLPEYQPLPDYPDYAGVEFGSHQDIPAKKMPLLRSRCLVGRDVHISARYQDACYVRWNWNRIRQSCIILNLSVFLALLCVGIGLLIQMPRGSECDPEHAWWQGSVLLEVHVPAFRDSDGDGLGDLPGLLSSIDHIQSLGVRGIRLSGIWGDGQLPGSSIDTTFNLTRIDPALGDTSHLILLASHLHQRGLNLLLDLPLTTHQAERGINLEEVYAVLKSWLKYGVDGFFFPDITEYANDPALVEAMHEWRNILDQFTHGMEHKVMMAPVALLDNLAATSFPHLGHLLHQLDLIDVPVNLTGSAQIIPGVLESATAWDSHASLPWINWNMAQGKGAGESYSEAPPSLGRTILLLFFPGTVTLYCCDELGPLSHQEESRLPVLGWAGEDAKQSDLGSLWRDWQNEEGSGEEAHNKSLATLSTMISARQEKVPIYINGIFDYEGDYHPTKSTNYRVRYADNDVIILDRFYPRRNQYAVVANLGTTTVNKDLSRYYYGGSVLASSHGHSGYVTFKNITLKPSEALACVLDL